MNLQRIIAFAILCGVAIAVMRSYGISTSDMLAYIKGESKKGPVASEADRRAYAERAASQLREEASKIPKASGEGIDNDLNRELAEERKRMLEERANAAQKVGSEILRGDVETLKHSVDRSARQAGVTQ